MTATPPPAWYPDPEHAGWQRYWDGSTWTDHRAPALTDADPKLKPGLVGVWITAVLSLFTFTFFWRSENDSVSIALPIGVIFMCVCWSLVRKARADAQRRGVPLPAAYTAAKITAGVLAGLSVLVSIVTTFG